jgi:hypothetical protein
MGGGSPGVRIGCAIARNKADFMFVSGSLTYTCTFTCLSAVFASVALAGRTELVSIVGQRCSVPDQAVSGECTDPMLALILLDSGRAAYQPLHIPQKLHTSCLTPTTQHNTPPIDRTELQRRRQLLAAPPRLSPCWFAAPWAAWLEPKQRRATFHSSLASSIAPS